MTIGRLPSDPPSRIPPAAPTPRAAAQATPVVAPAADVWLGDSTRKLTAGLDAYVRAPQTLPAYLGGYHPNWVENNDHCYSLLFRVAIKQGLSSDADARKLMARIPPGNPDAWRAVMFPTGFQELPIHVDGEHVQVSAGAIPAGYMISLDGGDHVMTSTGRLLPGGRHEVYSFKGGGDETPVWGDSVGYDPSPKVHVLALEDELENLLRDDQPLATVRAVAGRSALTP